MDDFETANPYEYEFYYDDDPGYYQEEDPPFDYSENIDDYHPYSELDYEDSYPEWDND